MLVCGIDGGGTSTRVLLAAGDGTVLGEGRGAAGNLHDVGPKKLRAHLAEAWTEAWRRAGRPPEPCAVAFFGMASVVTPEDRATVEELGESLGFAQRIEVDHDLRISLAGGIGGEHGIAVIAGTGSSCFGRAPDGTTWMAGGWGSFLDDRGSSHDLGKQALIACVRAFDGRGAPTVLSERIRERLQIDRWRELLSLVDAQGMTRSEIAALAPLVTDAVAEGDAVATAILDEGIEELALAVSTVSERLSFPDPHVVATGGLAESGARWSERFERAVLARVPSAHVVEKQMSPVRGAALCALQLAEIELTPATLARLRHPADE